MRLKDNLGVRIQEAMARTVKRLPAPALRRMAGDPVVIDGRTLDVRIQLAAAASADAPSFSDLDPPTARQGAVAAFEQTNGPRAKGVAAHDRTIGPRDLRVRIYRREQSDGVRPGVLFMHQGGFVIGDLDTCDTLCSRLTAELDAIVMSVDYRLAPEHPFPAQADDADAAWAWMTEHADGLGIDTTKLVVCGDSAGGQMAAALCQRLRDAGSPQPAVQVMVYPLVDATADEGSMVSCADTFPLTTETLEWFYGHALPDEFDRADPRFSPARASELGSVAPAIVVTAGFDPLRDQGEQFAADLRAAGVEVVDRCEHSLSHSFLAMGGLSPAASAAVDRIIDDIRPFIA